jgi:class I fructose-bisphosphate aldolase
VKCAGNAKVFVAGGFKTGENELLKMAADVMNAGASGLAVGRNIWQHSEPLKVAAALKDIIFETKAPELAVKRIKQ